MPQTDVVRRRSGRSSPFLAVLLLAACTRETPGVRVDVTDVAAAPPPPPPAISRFSVPLAYDFSPILRVVEEAVPKTFGSMDSVRTVGTDTRKHYAFEAQRGKFTTFAEGRELHLRATIAYRARGFYKPVIGPTLSAGCGGGAERPRIVVELATPLDLSAEWHLRSRARVVSVAPASSEQRDHCDVSILHHDVTERVVEAARGALASQLPKIDRKVAGVDLHDRFEGWWALLAKPIPLTDGVWLMLEPDRLVIGKVGGHDKTLIVPVSLDARPKIMMAREAPVPTTRPLPPLGHDDVSDGFHVTLDGVLDYGELSRTVTRALAGRVVTEGGRSVTIRTVRVVPASRGRLALSVGFAGDTKGTLDLVGTPRYEPGTRQVSVPDLDYELDTDSRIVNSYAWLRTDALRRTFRERSHVSADSALGRGRTLLLAGLNRTVGDVLTLSAAVDSTAVTGLYVTRDGLIVRAQANGHASVAVSQH